MPSPAERRQQPSDGKPTEVLAGSIELGLMGMGKTSLDLFQAFWDGLDELQRAELLAAAMEAGVNLCRFLNGDEPGMSLICLRPSLISNSSPWFE